MTYQEKALLDLFRQIEDEENKLKIIDCADAIVCYQNKLRQQDSRPAAIVNIDTMRRRKEKAAK